MDATHVVHRRRSHRRRHRRRRRRHRHRTKFAVADRVRLPTFQCTPFARQQVANRLLDAEDCAMSAHNTAEVSFSNSILRSDFLCQLVDIAMNPRPVQSEVATRYRSTIIGDRAEILTLISKVEALAAVINTNKFHGLINLYKATCFLKFTVHSENALGGKKTVPASSNQSSPQKSARPKTPVGANFMKKRMSIIQVPMLASFNPAASAQAQPVVTEMTRAEIHKMAEDLLCKAVREIRRANGRKDMFYYALALLVEHRGHWQAIPRMAELFYAHVATTGRFNHYVRGTFERILNLVLANYSTIADEENRQVLCYSSTELFAAYLGVLLKNVKREAQTFVNPATGNNVTMLERLDWTPKYLEETVWSLEMLFNWVSKCSNMMERISVLSALLEEVEEHGSGTAISIPFLSELAITQRQLALENLQKQKEAKVAEELLLDNVLLYMQAVQMGIRQVECVRQYVHRQRCRMAENKRMGRKETAVSSHTENEEAGVTDQHQASSSPTKGSKAVTVVDHGSISVSGKLTTQLTRKIICQGLTEADVRNVINYVETKIIAPAQEVIQSCTLEGSTMQKKLWGEYLVVHEKVLKIKEEWFGSLHASDGGSSDACSAGGELYAYTLPEIHSLKSSLLSVLKVGKDLVGILAAAKEYEGRVKQLTIRAQQLQDERRLIDAVISKMGNATFRDQQHFTTVASSLLDAFETQHQGKQTREEEAALTTYRAHKNEDRDVDDALDGGGVEEEGRGGGGSAANLSPSTLGGAMASGSMQCPPDSVLCVPSTFQAPGSVTFTWRLAKGTPRNIVGWVGLFDASVSPNFMKPSAALQRIQSVDTQYAAGSIVFHIQDPGLYHIAYIPTKGGGSVSRRHVAKVEVTADLFSMHRSHNSSQLDSALMGGALNASRRSSHQGGASLATPSKHRGGTHGGLSPVHHQRPGGGSASPWSPIALPNSPSSHSSLFLEKILPPKIIELSTQTIPHDTAKSKMVRQAMRARREAVEIASQLETEQRHVSSSFFSQLGEEARRWKFVFKDDDDAMREDSVHNSLTMNPVASSTTFLHDTRKLRPSKQNNNVDGSVTSSVGVSITNVQQQSASLPSNVSRRLLASLPPDVRKKGIVCVTSPNSTHQKSIYDLL